MKLPAASAVAIVFGIFVWSFLNFFYILSKQLKYSNSQQLADCLTYLKESVPTWIANVDQWIIYLTEYTYIKIVFTILHDFLFNTCQSKYRSLIVYLSVWILDSRNRQCQLFCVVLFKGREFWYWSKCRIKSFLRWKLFGEKQINNKQKSDCCKIMQTQWHNKNDLKHLDKECNNTYLFVPI